MEKLKYPIGKYIPVKNPTPQLLTQWRDEIEQFPLQLDLITNKLSKKELNWPYRPEGWKIKQVVHHCADSHMNAYIRFKLTLTEDNPSIKPYAENLWAKLADSLDDNIDDSMMLIKALHNKWGLLMRNLSDDQLQLEFFHPENGVKSNLAETIGNYAWHSNHHLAHIKNALTFKGRF